MILNSKQNKTYPTKNHPIKDGFFEHALTLVIKKSALLCADCLVALKQPNRTR